jgi:molybdate transport system substrate-binding protein
MKTLTLALGALAAMMSTAAVEAADIKVLASNGVRGTLEELAPAFERATANKLAITFGLAAVLKRQIEAGEAFDLAILTSAGIEDLARQGKIDRASRTSIARSGVGIAVRAGAPRPDISTAEALKRTLLAARSS